MKIQFKVSRTANQFFFISTLAAWHYSCRKDVQESWLDQTEPLSPKEEQALENFSGLMQTKYGFQSPTSYLGDIFYTQNERAIWPAVKKFVKNQKDYALLKNIFSTLDNRFSKTWQIKHTSLEILERSIKKERTTVFFNAVGSSFGAIQNSIAVIVLFSPLDSNHTAAGNANLKKGFVTLELPDLKEDTWQLSYSLAILGHEIGHMLFSNRNGNSIIKNAIKSLRLKNQYDTLPLPTLTILNEAITASFSPLGALGQTYFPHELAPLLFSNLPKAITVQPSKNGKKIAPYYGGLEIWFVWKLLPLSLSYVREKKPIDKNFVREAGMILKKAIEEK